MALRGWLIALLIAVLDQASKWWMLEIVRIDARPPIEVTSFFNLVMVLNRGVSFGMLSQPGELMPWILKGVALMIVVVLVRWLHRCADRWVALALGLIIGGATGNIIDRARFGGVVDFLDFHVGVYHWPAFNVADASICCGVMLLLWDGLLRSKPAPKASA